MDIRFIGTISHTLSEDRIRICRVRFSEKHNFAKPNDVRALQLMDHAARDVMEQYPDIVLAFGESDEYSFLLRKSTDLYNRRQAKIMSTLTSLFTSSYVFNWKTYFPDIALQYPPSFDGRIILYPAEQHIRDYFAWRQADKSAVPAATTQSSDAVHEPSDSSGDNLITSAFSPTVHHSVKLKREVKPKTEVVVLHCDVIKDQFWDDRRGILCG
ncbi:hypothetical protein C0992_004655 [Termitomyces sp. T32_za158]|nr:hypothetical protein C0992_004655 [Termitomyces sp. T32_za158]